MKLERGLELSRALKIFGGTLKEAAKAVSNTTATTKSIKRLTGSPRNDLSSKLITAGMACVLFPEPFISDMLGSALIVSGMLLKRRRGPTIIDIFKETKKIVNWLKV